MATLVGRLDWWKAKEIPFVETDWRAIQKYFPEKEEIILDKKRCVYLIRMSPPFLIAYNNGESPVVYVGSGHIGQRWKQHREWLYQLGAGLSGSRYEVWTCVPRVQNNIRIDDDIEPKILIDFRGKYGMLPFMNQKIQRSPREHTYPPGFLKSICDIGNDRRYRWAVWPWGRNELSGRYYRGEDNSGMSR